MKKILYVVSAIAVLYLILACFGPSSVKVERNIRIGVPAGAAIQKLSDLRFFKEKWNPWAEKDLAMVSNLRGNPGEIGQLLTWSGNDQVGKGEMEILRISADSVCERLSFESQGDAFVYLAVKPLGDTACEVNWGMQFDVGFFGRTPMLFMNLDKMMGGDYEKGLITLKTNLESDPSLKVTHFDIVQKDWEACTYLGRRETVSFEAMGKFFETNFGMLGMVMEKEKISPLSPASGLYFTYDEVNQKTDLSCAFKVKPGTKIKGWETYSYPSGKAVFVEFKGDPAQSGMAHKAIDDYMRKNSLAYSMVIEEYVFWPEKGKDPSNAITNIYYLLR